MLPTFDFSSLFSNYQSLIELILGFIAQIFGGLFGGGTPA